MADTNMNSIDIFPSFKTVEKPIDDQGAFTIDQKDIEAMSKTSQVNQSKEINNSTESTKKSNTNPLAQCDICSVPISSQIVYDTHIKGRKHQTQLTALLTKNPEYKSLTYDELCSKKQEPIIVNNEDTDTSALVVTKKLNCNICNVSCNSQQMFDNHVGGKKHQTKLKLASFTNPAPVRNIPDNNPSSSNYCDICSLKLNSEEELTEHLAQKKHQTRVKEAEICAKEANDMNINFDDYKISSTVTEKDAFIYQCTTCNKKVRTKMQLIDHLKSAPHIRLSNKSTRGTHQYTRGIMKRGGSTTTVTRSQSFSAHRGSTTPRGRSRPYSSSQRSSYNQTFDPQTSQNIFGAFDPDNQATLALNNTNNNTYSSTKRSTEYDEIPPEYDGFYPKRQRTYNDDNNNSNLQNYYTNDGNYYSTNNDPYSTQNTNYQNQPSVTQQQQQQYWPYQNDPYYDQQQQQYSNAESDYMNQTYYPSTQPPLPAYEPPPPPLPTYPPPSSHSTYSQPPSYYPPTENPETNHFYSNTYRH